MNTLVLPNSYTFYFTRHMSESQNWENQKYLYKEEIKPERQDIYYCIYTYTHEKNRSWFNGISPKTLGKTIVLCAVSMMPSCIDGSYTPHHKHHQEISEMLAFPF